MVLESSARRGVAVDLGAYLVVVARLTLWPAPAPTSTFDVVREVIAWLDHAGVPVTYAQVEAGANVLMFVPFGVLVGLLVRRWWVVVLLGLGTSTLIELSQLLFLPTRVATVQDVVLNTLGAALGLVALRAVRAPMTGRDSRITAATGG